MNQNLAGLRAHYRSGANDLAAEFFIPCLQEALRYRRAAGYFSSKALVTWAEALPRFVQDNHLKIQLIASPELSRQDLEVFRSLASAKRRVEYRQVVVNRMLKEVIALAEAPEDSGLRARVLAWLVANERLEVRFAFATHVRSPGVFHEKMGVFDFPDDLQVAFTGSANETWGGHHLNYESIDVYRSWVISDGERVSTKVQQFEEAWQNKATGLDVQTPCSDVVARLRDRAPKTLPTISSESRTGKAKSEDKDRWRHQDRALETFMVHQAGVLEMATGTGKTRTTLKIFDRLIEEKMIKAAIVTTEGTDLLDQWFAELEEWSLSSRNEWLIIRHFERYKQLGEFCLDPNGIILVISRGQLASLLDRISATDKKSMIIVHDEVHGLGVPSQVAALRGQHIHFIWRLGLSATPERAYDQIGNEFILEEIGPTIFRFPVQSAIERGVLSEFDYVPLEYELTEGDRKRLRDVYSRKAFRAQEGNPMSDEEVWIELAKVYKTAELKPTVFSSYLEANAGVLKRCIIFVETKEYGNGLLETIHSYTGRYRTYYAEDDRSHLVEFERGEIDCLITCHRISQGIDIRSLRAVVLFASARAKLETIQRIGRCLRVDPDTPEKRALVIDFVRAAGELRDGENYPSADLERQTWLEELSKVRRADNAR